MMKINSKLILGTIIAILIIICSTTVLAENAVIIGGGSVTENESANNEIVDIGNTQNTQNKENTNSTYNVVNTSTTLTSNGDQTLPQTGVADTYVVAILLTVCAISAIYAYRKIRDYNIK